MRTARHAQLTKVKNLFKNTKIAWVSKVGAGILEAQDNIDQASAATQPSQKKLNRLTQHLQNLKTLRTTVLTEIVLDELNPPANIDEINLRPRKYCAQLSPKNTRDVFESLFSLDVLASVWFPFGQYVDLGATWKASEDAQNFFFDKFC